MSRAWYLTALVPLAIGITIAVVSFSRLLDNLQSMQRMVAPGERTFVLNAGQYIIYGETTSTVDGVAYHNTGFSLNCRLTAEDGTTIPLERPTGKITYAMGGHEGTGMFEFDLAGSSNVKLSCETDGGKAVVAIGGGIGAAIVVAIVCGLFGVLGGVAVLLVVYFVRRKVLARERARGAA